MSGKTTLCEFPCSAYPGIVLSVWVTTTTRPPVPEKGMESPTTPLIARL